MGRHRSKSAHCRSSESTTHKQKPEIRIGDYARNITSSDDDSPPKEPQSPKHRCTKTNKKRLPTLLPSNFVNLNHVPCIQKSLRIAPPQRPRILKSNQPIRSNLQKFEQISDSSSEDETIQTAPNRKESPNYPGKFLFYRPKNVRILAPSRSRKSSLHSVSEIATSKTDKKISIFHDLRPRHSTIFQACSEKECDKINVSSAVSRKRSLARNTISDESLSERSSSEDIKIRKSVSWSTGGTNDDRNRGDGAIIHLYGLSRNLQHSTREGTQGLGVSGLPSIALALPTTIPSITRQSKARA